MRTIELGDIELRGTDAQGRFAMARVDGEWVGVSLDGEDECVRDLDDLQDGTLVEVGTERMRVAAGSAIARNDTLVDADGDKFVVTAIRNGGVYGVPVTAVDEHGTAAGSERYLGSVDEVESGARGQVYAAS